MPIDSSWKDLGLAHAVPAVSVLKGVLVTRDPGHGGAGLGECGGPGHTAEGTGTGEHHPGWARRVFGPREGMSRSDGMPDSPGCLPPC